jgi:Smg protein
LFENYLEEGIHPDRQILERELSLAGFDSNDINQAFAWLSDLDTLSRSSYSPGLADSRAVRYYSESESVRIDQECRGFLTFLESSNILNPVQREWVIDRALALPDREVTLEKVKWIVLIVLWRQGATQDYLLLEDLLFGDSQPLMH